MIKTGLLWQMLKDNWPFYLFVLAINIALFIGALYLIKWILFSG